MYKTRPALLFGLLALSLFSAAIVGTISARAGSAFAQGQSGDNAEQAKTTYKPEYPQAKADSRNSFIVQTDKHLYKPGEEVMIQGSIFSTLIDEIGSVATVKLNVTDNKGNVTAEEDAQVDSEGQFSASVTLPENAELGSYSITAMIDVEASVLDTLNASVKAKLGTSARFEVISPVAFAVKAEGKDFEVKIASNSSSVTGFAFTQAEKKVSFKVAGETGTKGVAQVTLPKELLAGKLVVSIDGRAVAEDSNEVIVTSDTATEMTLEINYPHSEHTVEITGTNAVPEFPISMLVMAAALGSTVLIFAKHRNNWFNNKN